MTDYLWVEKYRPKELTDYIGNESMKAAVGRFIASGDVPHLLLSGPPGTGKTTVAKIIAHQLRDEADTMYINASDENSVDTIRNKIRTFAQTAGFKNIKIIILDEADFMTTNAQAALRNIMETFHRNTRFILTCNFVEKMLDAIISRTQQFHVVPPSKVDVAKHVYGILQKEEVEAEITDLKLLIDAHYPDIRKIIQECQLHSHSGTLKLDKYELIASDTKLQIIEALVAKDDSRKKFQKIRQIIADARIRDFSDIYRLLFDRVDEYSPNNISGAILAIAEGQYKDSMVVDKEINMMATLINILQVMK